MKAKLDLLTATMFLATLNAGLGQPVLTQQPGPGTDAVGTAVLLLEIATGDRHSSLDAAPREAIVAL